MTNTAIILVIDDDVEIWRLIFKTLTPAGFKVKLAQRQVDFLRQIFSSHCSLVILGEESIESSYVKILKDLREWSTIPVIVLSSLHPEEAVLAASVTGVNGYISVPFSQRELLASVRSVLRLYNNTHQGIRFEIDSISIDFENRTVTKKGKIVELTTTELSLLFRYLYTMQVNC
jgi:Response regulators consisting of a CheY-like receiver domain and a winged-helix DNA-binding domain